MADTYVFDDVMEEESGVEETTPKAAWTADGELTLDDIEVTEETAKTLWDRFCAMLMVDRNSLIPLFNGRLVEKCDFAGKMTLAKWRALPEGTNEAYQGFAKWMEEFTVGELCKCATRFLTSGVYTTDSGDHANKYYGCGHYSFEKRGEWELNERPYPYVVPVDAGLEAAAFAASAGVKLETQTKYVANAEGAPIATTTYKYSMKFLETRHPLELKRALKGFLALDAGDKMTAETMKKRKFIWEVLASKIVALRVTTPDMTPLNAFYYYVNKKMDLKKARIDIHDFLNLDLVYLNYSHVIHKSWFLGGLHIRNESFMIQCQAKIFKPEVAWSGMIDTRLPNWAYSSTFIYERGGASAGDPNLALTVRPIDLKERLTGVVWNPQGAGDEYAKACGVALPLGSHFQSAQPALEWVGFVGVSSVLATLIIGPKPFILIMKKDALRPGASKVFGAADSTAISRLFNMAPALGMYNFVCNMMRINDPNYPIYPVFTMCIKTNEFSWGHIDPKVLPVGRYTANVDAAPGDNSILAFDRFIRAGAERAPRREPSPAGADHVGGSGKRGKPSAAGDPATKRSRPE